MRQPVAWSSIRAGIPGDQDNSSSGLAGKVSGRHISNHCGSFKLILDKNAGLLQIGEAVSGACIQQFRHYVTALVQIGGRFAFFSKFGTVEISAHLRKEPPDNLHQHELSAFQLDLFGVRRPR